MKPEELHATVFLELGLQFDEDSHSIYGTQSGYLLFLQETGREESVSTLCQCGRTYNSVDSEENEWFGMSLSESLPNLSTLSINQYLVSFVVWQYAQIQTIEKLQTLNRPRSIPETHHFVQVCAYMVRRVLLVLSIR